MTLNYSDVFDLTWSITCEVCGEIGGCADDTHYERGDFDSLCKCNSCAVIRSGFSMASGLCTGTVKEEEISSDCILSLLAFSRCRRTHMLCHSQMLCDDLNPDEPYEECSCQNCRAFRNVIKWLVARHYTIEAN
jgi:hypothetical protein